MLAIVAALGFTGGRFGWACTCAEAIKLVAAEGRGDTEDRADGLGSSALVSNLRTIDPTDAVRSEYTSELFGSDLVSLRTGPVDDEGGGIGSFAGGASCVELSSFFAFSLLVRDDLPLPFFFFFFLSFFILVLRFSFFSFAACDAAPSLMLEALLSLARLAGAFASRFS